jgi:hypothetical protein
VPSRFMKAAPVDALKAALQTFATTTSTAVNVAQIAAAAVTLSTALGLIAAIPTTKLEAT